MDMPDEKLTNSKIMWLTAEYQEIRKEIDRRSKERRNEVRRITIKNYIELPIFQTGYVDLY